MVEKIKIYQNGRIWLYDYENDSGKVHPHFLLLWFGIETFPWVIGKEIFYEKYSEVLKSPK